MSQDQFNKNEKFPRFQPNRDENKKGGPKFSNYWVWAILLATVIGFSIFSPFGKRTQPITVGEFKDMLRKHHVEKYTEVTNKNIVRVSIKKDSLREYLDKLPTNAISNKKDEKPPQFSFESNERFREEILEFKKQNPAYFPDESYDPYFIEKDSTWFSGAVSFILPVLLFLAIWILLMRKMSGGGGAGGGPGGIFNSGKSKATLFDKGTKVNITFADVAGLDEAKVEVMEIVDFLKNPKKYTNLGGKIPKGALLIGPPGTGKTLLAKAMAGEAQVPFFSLSGSDFVEMFVGVGASRVRDLFKQAREKAPCIIFIDEIDAIGRARGKNVMMSNDERESTLNQLLVEMDGFGTDAGIIVLAATNRPDVLDNALLRPGRFDRQISIDKPDLKGREAIFKVHLKPIKISEKVDIHKLAEQTPGFAGADIANICNEAALIAARKGKQSVDMHDFQDAIDRVIGGLEKKNKLISPEEKKIVAYHEAGHAVAGWYLEHADPLVKVSIVPRGVAALGYAQYLPREQFLYQTEQMMDEMCMAFGGRAAEEIVFGKISTGALSDLERITKMAYSIVTIYGMNPAIGNMSFYDSKQSEYSFQKPYSDATAEKIDIEVKNIIDGAYERTKGLLTQHRKHLDVIAKELLEKEILFQADLERLIGKRPFEKLTTYQQFTNGKGKYEKKQQENEQPGVDPTPTLEGEKPVETSN